MSVMIQVPLPGGSVDVASVHRLGRDTAAHFGLKYATKDIHGKSITQACVQTCFFVTCRALGAALCAHGDEHGLVFPPRLAQIQVVIVPIITNEDRKAENG